MIRTHSLILKLIAVVAGLALYGAGLQVAFATHIDATLDAEPEDGEGIVGTIYFIKAELSSTVEEVVNIDAELEPVSDGNPASTDPDSANDDDGNSPTTPDLESCNIPVGETWCFISYEGTAAPPNEDDPAIDQICLWVDVDGDDETADGDCGEEPEPEGDPVTDGNGDHCDSVPGPADGEPDCTDVVTVEWTTNEATTLDCDDSSGADRERETNEAEESEVYSCRLRSSPGVPADGTVYGENLGGANDPDDGASFDTPDYFCVTGDSGSGASSGNGNCQITVEQSSGQQGMAEICFWSPGTGPGEDQGGDSGLCGSEAVGEVQQSNLSDAGNDMADSVELTWSAAGTTTTTTTTTGTGTTQTTQTTTTTTGTTGAMSTPPGQTTTTTTTRPAAERVPTNLSIQYRRGKFSGSVGSSKTRCQAGRRITLKKKKSGPDRTLGVTRSKRNSKWSIRKRARRGKYYAVAAKKVFTAGDGHRVICRADRSPVIRRR